MPKEIFYRQCELQKGEGPQQASQVSWIPEEHAVVGHYVKLKSNDEWSDGWRVVSVGETRRSAKEVNARSRDHVSQRPASDR